MVTTLPEGERYLSPDPFPAPTPGAFASPGEISSSLAVAAFAGTSMSPERRGDRIREEYAAHLNGIAAQYRGRIADADLESYRAGYRKRYTAWLNAMSRCMSVMIAGPSNFPTRRNEKRNDIERRRLEELMDYQQKGAHRLYLLAHPEFIPIATGAADAVGRLAEKQAAELTDHDHMKAANALWRKLTKGMRIPDTRDEPESYTPAIKEAMKAALQSLPKHLVRSAFGQAYGERVPFQAWELSNARARIKRLSGQATVAARLAGTPTEEWTNGDVTVTDNAEAERVQIGFPGKPDAATIARLKSRGFRWSPSNQAWQRQRTSQALYEAKQIAGIA